MAGAGVHDVAAAIIEAQNAAGRSIDKMQLQKLLYLTQGASIAFHGVPAFRSSFKAYRHGPVVAEVEFTYREAVEGRGSLEKPLGGDPNRIHPDLRIVIDEVLSLYGEWTGPNLEKITKRPDSPWQRARQGVEPGAASSNEIDMDDIASWFLSHPVDPNPVTLREDVDYEDLASEQDSVDYGTSCRWDETTEPQPLPDPLRQVLASLPR